MYRQNLLNRKVLITTDEVIFHADIDTDALVKNLLNSIIVAEERFIKKFVCKDLYYDLRDKKNVLVDSLNLGDLQEKINTDNNGEALLLKEGDIVNAIDLLDEEDPYRDLWNEYLWKICAECVAFVSLPTRWIQTKAAGEMMNNPQSITSEQNSQSADIKSVRWKSDKMLMDRIEPLLDAMKEWLCDNKDKFSKFTCYKCPVKDAKVSTGRTPWVRNVYRDCDDDNRSHLQKNLYQ